MRRVALTILSIAGLIAAAPETWADPLLQDFGININGTAYDYNNTGQTDPTTLPGMNATAFSTYTSGDMAGTGLGTLTYTFNPGGTGPYAIDFYLDSNLSAPFYNEYGTVNGSAPAGMSYEIAQVNPSVGGIQFWDSSTQVLPLALDNTNHVPVGNTNYLLNCTVAPCNADVALALGFNFTIPVGDEAVITIDSSTVNPGGFNLQQTHPIDPNNTSIANLFLSGSISFQPAGGPPPPPPSVPEPSSVILFGTVAVIVGLSLRRKLAKV